jgi:Tfp pilus assembly protein PilF
MAEYETARKLDPENAAAWEALTLNYATLARSTDALKAAEETLKRNPGSATAHLVRASVYEERGDRDKAREDYRQALALSGDNPGIAQLAQAALQRLGE